MFLKCNRTGNLMFSTKEAERHAEETGFQDFAQVAPDAPVLVVADGRKLKLFWDMEEFTRFKQRTRADDLEAESMSVREYKLRLDSLQSMVPAALAPADATPMDTSDEAASSAPPSSAAAAAQPMDTGDTVADQAISMLPGVEALQEPGLSDGQTKMVRETAEGGGFVAVVYKWEMKAAKWTKHREVVDEDQPAELDAAEKALAVANTEFCQSLMEMGFPEYRCKKALLLTGNDSVEHGIQWLTEHVEDPLADAPLTIVQVKAALKPKLTKEEKLARASELQKRAQETRKKREAAEKIEKEKAERESGKRTTEQMRLMQEQEQKVRTITPNPAKFSSCSSHPGSSQSLNWCLRLIALAAEFRRPAEARKGRREGTEREDASEARRRPCGAGICAVREKGRRANSRSGSGAFADNPSSGIENVGESRPWMNGGLSMMAHRHSLVTCRRGNFGASCVS